MLFGFGEAIPAIYRFVPAGLKGNLGLFAATSAGSGIHLALASIAEAAAFAAGSFGFTGRTASGTALGFIGETFSGKKLLFFNRKGEGFAAIGAGK